MNIMSMIKPPAPVNISNSGPNDKMGAFFLDVTNKVIDENYEREKELFPNRKKS